jgi:hypothetical protein
VWRASADSPALTTSDAMDPDERAQETLDEQKQREDQEERDQETFDEQRRREDQEEHDRQLVDEQEAWEQTRADNGPGEDSLEDDD